MKKFLLFVLGISFCIFLVFISFEFFLRSIPNDFTTKIHYLNKNKENIEVLTLGSSHTFVGVDSKYLELPSHNLAYSSQTLDLDELIFDRYKNQLPNLKTVIIPVSYFSYVLALEDGTSVHKIKNYNIYYQLHSHTFLLNNQFEILHQSINDNLSDIKLFKTDSDFKITVDSTGFINKRYIKGDLDWEESARHAVKNHSKDMNDALNKTRVIQNTKSLENIVAWCYNNRIKVILVSSPTTNSYLEKLDKKQFDHWRITTTYITEKYSNTIWLNYLQNNSYFTDEDFQNADHLNANGAIKMTKLINQYL